MAQKKGKRTLYIVIGVLAIAVLAIGIVAFVRSLEPASPSEPQQSSPSEDQPSQKPANTNESTATPSDESTNQPVIDPERVSTTDIEPMMITVAYIKGINGFDFQILRNPNGSKYVQFSSPSLVGTKCTNDTGVFASIIENPTADERGTLSKTTVVDGTTFGLSLADESCTNNSEELKQYQASFSEPFTLLKKM